MELFASNRNPKHLGGKGIHKERVRRSLAFSGSQQLKSRSVFNFDWDRTHPVGGQTKQSIPDKTQSHRKYSNAGVFECPSSGSDSDCFEKLWDRWEKDQGSTLNSSANSGGSSSRKPGLGHAGRRNIPKTEEMEDLIHKYAERGRLRLQQDDAKSKHTELDQQQQWLKNHEEKWSDLMAMVARLGSTDGGICNCMEEKELSDASGGDMKVWSGLKFADIPWPFLTQSHYGGTSCANTDPASVGLTREKVLLGLQWPQSTKAEKRKSMKQAMRRWHPDKFLQLLGPYLVENEKERRQIIEATNSVFQELSSINSRTSNMNS
jgi:hypothetical protein